ncbi:hypothetical protein IPJ72_06105 [Candidatus Peregrinibacteria bacterium]|nr:MAG: hypothetical protein IPJ72_06105 [Candidatus Peregrinibacteria bacterium]
MYGYNFKKTRRAFAEYLVCFSNLREIHAYFDDQDIEYIELEGGEQQSGERRSLIYGYYKSISWGKWNDISKVIAVFEEILGNIHSAFGDMYKEQQKRLINALESDGFYLEEGKLVHKNSFPLSENSALHSSELLNNRQLKLHIQRMENSINSDPDLAIGNAKELIETTCKNILDNEKFYIRRTMIYHN